MDGIDGWSVLEVGEYVSAPYAGKLCADLGADVLKIEPPGGDPARRVGPFAGDPGPDASGFFGYLNTGKRSVTLAEDGLGRDVIYDLIESEGIDLVIENRLSAYGIDPRALSDAFPALSVVSISGFGATGPWQEYDAPELVAWAESGHMNKCGYPDGPPSRPRLKSTDYWAGQMAAASGLSALLYRDLQGGDGQFVDVSKREAGVSAMEFFVAGYSWSGATTQRTGDGYPDQGAEHGYPTVFEAKDGYVSATPLGGERWETFCTEFIDRAELVEDERFATLTAARQHADEAKAIVEEYTRDHGKWELFEAFQAHGIASAVTATPEDIATFGHLEERDFWQEVPLPSGEVVTMPGFPFRIDRDTVAMERAPRLGEHDAAVFASLGYDPERVSSTRGAAGVRSSDREPGGGRSPRPGSGASSGPTRAGDGTRAETDGDADGARPLDGVRVLDFTWIYAGPVATKYLAALGADVVKVESAHKPDGVRNARGFGVFDPDENLNVSAYFNEQNLGKRGIQLDLTSDRGHDLALELMAEADVVMENYSPNFMDRVGLDYETIREVNPDVIYCSMPGWGKEGPARTYRAYGLNLQSMAGLDHLSGFPDDPPTTAGFSWPDPTAGFTAVVAVLSALLSRQASGEGGFIEVPQFETTLTFLHKPLVSYLLSGELPERIGNRDEDDRVVQGAYPCAGEDRWAVVAVEDDGQWARLCRVLGRPELVDDERFASQYARLEHHDAVDEVIADWTADRSREEVRDRLQDHDVPAGAVSNERDLMDLDPQLRVRDYFPEFDHPEVGRRRYQGPPFRMSACDVSPRSRAPLFGEHTEAVLAEWLSYTAAEIEDADEVGALY